MLSGVPISIFGGVWLVIPLWFSMLLFEAEGGTETERQFLIVFLVPFFGIGIGALFYPVLRYFEHESVRYVLTGSEVVILGGFLFLRRKVIPINSVTSLASRSGFLGLMQRFGNVEISTGELERAGLKRQTFVGIHGPEQVVDLIASIIETRRNSVQ